MHQTLLTLICTILITETSEDTYNDAAELQQAHIAETDAAPAVSMSFAREPLVLPSRKPAKQPIKTQNSSMYVQL